MFSVVIPTLNEEKFLPKLLDSIKKQDLQPSEIIVADADSSDKTHKIAKEYGCKIVQGGRIAVGRNNGAKLAKEKIVVFMDADTVIPHKRFFNKIIGKFIAENADVASSYILPAEKRVKYAIPIAGLNAMKFFTHKMKRELVVGGACLIITKDLFNQLNGFDARLKFREDSDFCKRAIKRGKKFIVIPEFIKISTRRYEKYGWRNMAVLGIVGLTATLAGASWLKKIQRKKDAKFWDDVK